jgi:hypothetical protein
VYTASHPPDKHTSQNYRCFPPDNKNPIFAARREILIQGQYLPLALRRTLSPVPLHLQDTPP